MFETPSKEIFEEMQNIAIEIWNTYDNTYWYVDEKLWYINQLENYQDNAMVMYRMFDHINQAKFLNECSKEVRDYINNNQ